ncbi:hypothetical protein RJ639_021569 [Escallonia herrerae]|uniref:Retrotransposon gag domain-containing protein n=1 Tax=Escallonia herrerae TaxID=1293975 RepID=A0AA89AGS7_9ASTE|nr:hypothetical protein RJ639_021569 [Escallonia herrerae]
MRSELKALREHLEQYFEALDIDKKKTVVIYLNDIAALRWRRRYTDGCDVKTWEKFKHELKRQFYSESIKDMAMINLQWLRKKGSIHEYVDLFTKELDDLIGEKAPISPNGRCNSTRTSRDKSTAQGPQGTSHGAPRRTSCL